MAILPKQLQPFDETVIPVPAGGQIGGPSFGDRVVLSAGITPVADYTVNTMIRFLEEDYNTNYITTIDHVRQEPRFRPFDTDFGDVVVYPSGVQITVDQSAGEIIDIMRVLWGIDREVTDNSFGYASSTLN